MPRLARAASCAFALLLATPALAETTTQTGMRYAESGFGPAQWSANLNRSVRFGDHKTGASASLGLSLSASEENTFGPYRAAARMTPRTIANLRGWKALRWGRLDCSGAVTPALLGAQRSLSATCGVSASKRFGSRAYGSVRMSAGGSGEGFGAQSFTGNASLQLTPAPKRVPRLRVNTSANYALSTQASGAESARWRGQVTGSHSWSSGLSLNLGANAGLQESAYAASAWRAASRSTARDFGVTASLGGRAGEGRWRANLSASQSETQSGWGASESARVLVGANWSSAAEPGRWQRSVNASLGLSRSGASGASNEQRVSLRFRPAPPAPPLSEAHTAPAPQPTLSVSLDLSRTASRSTWDASENWSAMFRIERSIGFWQQRTTP